MNRQLLIQRGVIVVVLLAAVLLALAGILNSGTTPIVKVIVIGVLVGLVVGGLVSAARGGGK